MGYKEACVCVLAEVFLSRWATVSQIIIYLDETLSIVSIKYGMKTKVKRIKNVTASIK